MPMSCETCRENLALLVEPRVPAGEAGISPRVPDAPGANGANGIGNETSDNEGVAGATALLTQAERAELETHIASCPECARELALLRSITSAMHAVPIATAPTDLRARVRAGIAGNAVSKMPEARVAQKAPLQPSRLSALHDFFRRPARVAWASGVALAAFTLVMMRNQPMGTQIPPHGDSSALKNNPAPPNTSSNRHPASSGKRAAPAEHAVKGNGLRVTEPTDNSGASATARAGVGSEPGATSDDRESIFAAGRPGGLNGSRAGHGSPSVTSANPGLARSGSSGSKTRITQAPSPSIFSDGSATIAPPATIAGVGAAAGKPADGTFDLKADSTPGRRGVDNSPAAATDAAPRMAARSMAPAASAGAVSSERRADTLESRAAPPARAEAPVSASEMPARQRFASLTVLPQTSTLHPDTAYNRPLFDLAAPQTAPIVRDDAKNGRGGSFANRAAKSVGRGDTNGAAVDRAVKRDKETHGVGGFLDLGPLARSFAGRKSGGDSDRQDISDSSRIDIGPTGPAGPSGPRGVVSANTPQHDEISNTASKILAAKPALQSSVNGLAGLVILKGYAGGASGFPAARLRKMDKFKAGVSLSAGRQRLAVIYAGDAFSVGRTAHIEIPFLALPSPYGAEARITLPDGLRFASQPAVQQPIALGRAIKTNQAFQISFDAIAVRSGEWPVTVTFQEPDGTKLDAVTVKVIVASGRS